MEAYPRAYIYRQVVQANLYIYATYEELNAKGVAWVNPLFAPPYGARAVTSWPAYWSASNAERNNRSRSGICMSMTARRRACNSAGPGDATVAVLIQYMSLVGDVETISDLTSALSSLDRDAMQAVLIRLVQRNPHLLEALQIELSRIIVGPASNPEKMISNETEQSHLISASEVRMRVRKAISRASKIGYETYHYDDDGYQVGMEICEAVDPIVDVAYDSIGAGNFAYACSLLDAVTDELISGWSEIEDFRCEDEDLFLRLGDAWAAALLEANCSAEDRGSWLVRLEDWRRAGGDIGADIGLAHACLAASEGWEHPPLLRKLSGDVLKAADNTANSDEFGKRLTAVRVSMLTDQGRLEDAAKLAGADGLHEKYVELLVSLGLVIEAVEYGMQNLKDRAAALVFAKCVYASGETELAVKVGERGQNLPGYGSALAVWTRDAANSIGQRDLAIRAGVTALQADATEDDYVSLRLIAAEQWPDIRKSVLAHILESSDGLDEGEVDILLSEGMLLEALSGVEKSYNYRLVERVVEACLPVYPEQVIPICRAQAEAIIGLVKADRYHHAIRWLALARNAYVKMNHIDEWLKYKGTLIGLHSRKSSLMPGLRSL